MEVKGTSLKSTLKFVKTKYPDRLDEWLKNLPARSRELFSDVILATNWYPAEEALIIPTEVTGKLFFDNDSEKASFEIGKFSAYDGLTGIYKIFMRVASPEFVLSRSGKIIQTYYKDTRIIYEKIKDNEVILTLEGFTEKEKLIFERTKGWIYQALVLLKKQPQEIFYNYEKTYEDFVTCKMTIKWK